MDNSNRPILDEFGQLLMEKVRDDALSHIQRLITGKLADIASKELNEQFEQLDASQAKMMRYLLAKAVDAGIVRFLHFIDEYELDLNFKRSSGEVVNIRSLSDGLAGELHTDRGWIAKFSHFGDHLDPVK